MLSWFRQRRGPQATELWDRWFRPVVPEGHASLEAFESLLTTEETERLPKTLAKLAAEGAERIHRVRKHDLDPDRGGLAYLDELCGPALLQNLTAGQDPADPRNLLRVVTTEFGCVLGEIYVRTGRGSWRCARAPNLWRSGIVSPSGRVYDPFRAIVRQLSEEREGSALLRNYDAFL